jgi:23S rRNA pseudouridine1911/1915/1917 synthase
VAHLSIEPNELVTYKVAHEDDDVLVVVKPARVVTLPGKGHDRNTLLNGLFARYGNKLQNVGREREFGLLHRLDRETSGLVMLALRPSAYDHLVAMFKERKVAKFYWAVVQDAPDRPSGVINRPIAERNLRKGGKFGPLMKVARISGSGKPSATAYRVLQASRHGALLECRAITGRLHQLRVHLDAIGCPILGDDLYGPETVRDASPRLALHAHRVAFPHPNGKVLDVRSAWPQDLKGLLQRLGMTRPDLGVMPGVTLGGNAAMSPASTPRPTARPDDDDATVVVREGEVAEIEAPELEPSGIDGLGEGEDDRVGDEEPLVGEDES